MNQTQIPIVYNLFPNHFGPIENWEPVIEKIRGAGFNTIYINPLHFPGYSGSLYAVKDYYRYNPLFFSHPHRKGAEKKLKKFLRQCKRAGFGVWMDLVINHTSFDSVLLEKHPDWFVRDEQGDPVHPGAYSDGTWIQWGDLIEIDFSPESKKRREIIEYFQELIHSSLQLGFTGFRCDAAYQVPADVWITLIESARKIKPSAVFFAESLGCGPEQTIELSHAGFDFVSSSVRWWDFRESWAMDQYEQIRHHAPSISFPENHDTERLLEKYGGNILRTLLLTQFTALLTRGWMITSGFEDGHKNRCHVVESRPENREPVRYDLMPFLKRLIQLKLKHSVFYEEGPIQIVEPHSEEQSPPIPPQREATLLDEASDPEDEEYLDESPVVFGFLKQATSSGQRAFLLMNFDTEQNQEFLLPDREELDPAFYHEELTLTAPPFGPIHGKKIILEPGELRIFLLTDKAGFASQDGHAPR